MTNEEIAHYGSFIRFPHTFQEMSAADRSDIGTSTTDPDRYFTQSPHCWFSRGTAQTVNLTTCLS